MSEEKSELKLESRHTAIVVIDLQKGIAQMPGGAPHSKPDVIAKCARQLAPAGANYFFPAFAGFFSSFKNARFFSISA
jgi:hypothetical protein